MNSPSPTTAADFFSAIASSYDSLIRRAVPRYEDMTRALIDRLPLSAGRVLELGAGTGNLTLALAGRFPRAEIVTVDASPEMLAVVESRAASMPAPHARLRFLGARFEDLDLPPGGFDLVASCISLHHVIDKAALFRAIHRWLAPGGVLRYSDQCRGETDADHARIWAEWLAFCREPGHCTEGEIRELLDHAAAHDHYTPATEQCALLRAAGFAPQSIRCVWKHNMWAVIVADR